MFIINNEIDLGKSFEKLKKHLDLTKMDSNWTHEEVAYAFGHLRSAVKKHIAECTQEDSVDDIPKSLFSGPSERHILGRDSKNKN